MRHTEISAIDRALAALDAADKLEATLLAEIERIKGLSPLKVLAKAGKILTGGESFSPSKLGLSDDVEEKVKTLININRHARTELRGYMQENREACRRWKKSVS
ncbi:hypothetical protein AT251_24200 [Enterovibrio nigricans]|nr:hypothetical protein [Enterovibrio nigricans]PKF48703.1 hypothetical protein AT251_24200 [Enterovibrio nigricans]